MLTWNDVDLSKEHMLDNQTLSAEQQAELSPAEVLEILKKGNHEFTQDKLTIRNNMERVRNASLGQYPKAVIVSCLDSRVPVEDVFHRGIGDIFVARIAGNIINEDILGSLEYACKVSGAKLIMVLGHDYCGAITSAIQGMKLGNITTLLSKIEPAITNTNHRFKGNQSYQNVNYVAAVCYENVKVGMRIIRQNSPILRDMEEKGEIIITGGIYDMELGEVDFLE